MSRNGSGLVTKKSVEAVMNRVFFVVCLVSSPLSLVRYELSYHLSGSSLCNGCKAHGVPCTALIISGYICHYSLIINRRRRSDPAAFNPRQYEPTYTHKHTHAHTQELLGEIIQLHLIGVTKLM